MNKDRPIGVVGAGTMGTGVAQCLAQAGYDVIVVEPDAAAGERARKRLADAIRLTVLLGQGGGGADVLARVWWSDDLSALASASMVIECAPELQDLKEALFAELSSIAPPDTILASCTSAIPVATLAARTGRPDQVLGLHFMNPAPLKRTVEVVRGPRTSAATIAAAERLLANLGKEAIVVGDGPGFVLNRVLMQVIVQAATSGEEPAVTDAVFERCLGHPMGPLRTADLIGLDNVLDTLTVLRAHTGDDRFLPPAALTERVEAGHLGQKTGRGFHVYR